MEIITVIISLGISTITFILGRLHGAKNEGEKQGKLLTELENIKQDVKEIKSDFKQINAEKIYAELNFLKSEMVSDKNQIALINKRIDDHITKQHSKQ